ncbi:endonuclease III [Planctomycetota bacterium]|nr:endonuclease III [Planctomycetota bacterium]MSR39209.1 endonuclease III [Planctomycetota bacterium]GDY02346.1 endonuclease III [Planctomycetota bacterium]
MKRHDKAVRISALLDQLIGVPEVPLHHEDHFTLLIAVLLSAQCTDVRVNQVTKHLFAKASTPLAMAQLSEDEIRAIIRPCGLSPQKSKAIRRLSQILLRDFDGTVPRDLAALESLPGVGHKTASVVMAQAFGVASFPVDTHIHRLAARWGLSPGRNVVATERDLKRVFPEAAWNTLHLQIIWFGRRFCRALRHDPDVCPICSFAMSQARKARERRARNEKRS